MNTHTHTSLSHSFTQTCMSTYTQLHQSSFTQTCMSAYNSLISFTQTCMSAYNSLILFHTNLHECIQLPHSISHKPAWVHTHTHTQLPQSLYEYIHTTPSIIFFHTNMHEYTHTTPSITFTQTCMNTYTQTPQSLFHTNMHEYTHAHTHVRNLSTPTPHTPKTRHISLQKKRGKEEGGKKEEAYSLADANNYLLTAWGATLHLMLFCACQFKNWL